MQFIPCDCVNKVYYYPIIMKAMSFSISSNDHTNDIEHSRDVTLTVNKPINDNRSQYFLVIMDVTCMSNLVCNDIEWCLKAAIYT